MIVEETEKTSCRNVIRIPDTCLKWYAFGIYLSTGYVTDWISETNFRSILNTLKCHSVSNYSKRALSKAK